jgi:hypothetical protein
MKIIITFTNKQEKLIRALDFEIQTKYLRVIVNDDLSFYYSHVSIDAFTIDEEETK